MSSTKVLSALAAVALILFVALITLQVIELNHHKADPSAWPAEVQ